MLVLSRKIEETIQMPELGIEIRVLKVRGGTVSIGIEAPRRVKVLRGELTTPETNPVKSDLWGERHAYRMAK